MNEKFRSYMNLVSLMDSNNKNTNDQIKIVTCLKTIPFEVYLLNISFAFLFVCLFLINIFLLKYKGFTCNFIFIFLFLRLTKYDGIIERSTRALFSTKNSL